ncbi:TetR/AcrR family transcriptional regulator [Roseibium sp.]|uniref:TetR/AcrR family transcriptional regulator n=1 Tax=Roseibium sp. TaxID=1936156 RepID=UPI003A982C7F
MERQRPYDREKALDAALLLFWERGYHATSLKDLEAALKMKPGSIYAAFTNKETLFSLALKRYFEKNYDEFRAAMEQASSPLGGLADFLRSLGTLQQDNPKCRACMLVKTLLNTTAEETAIASQAGGYLDQMEAEMAAAFQKAIDLGELPQTANPQRLARRFQSDLTSLKIEAYRGVPAADLMNSAEELAQELGSLRQTV